MDRLTRFVADRVLVSGSENDLVVVGQWVEKARQSLFVGLFFLYLLEFCVWIGAMTLSLLALQPQSMPWAFVILGMLWASPIHQLFDALGARILRSRFDRFREVFPSV